MRPSTLKSVIVVFLLFLVLFIPSLSWADETEHTTVGVTVPTLFSLVLSTPSFSFSDIGVSEMNTGYVEAIDALTITLSSNVAWTLSVKTYDENMGTSTNGSYVKPLNDFLWRKDGGSYAAITNNDVEVTSDENYAHDNEVTLDYKMLLDWAEDAPGEYGLTVTVTLAEAP